MPRSGSRRQYFMHQRKVYHTDVKTMNIGHGKTGPDDHDHMIIVIESRYGKCHIYVQFTATVYL